MKNEQKTDKNPIDLNELSKEELIEKVLNLSNKNNELEKQINWMNEQLILSKKKLFGPSSEKTENPEQISLFNEAEADVDTKVPEPQIEEMPIVYWIVFGMPWRKTVCRTPSSPTTENSISGSN